MVVKKKLEYNYGAFPPLGLAYIASGLEQDNHKVRIVDCFGEGLHSRSYSKDYVRIGLANREILERIGQFSPDIIGISNNFTLFSEDAMSVARVIKERYRNIPVIMGGAHASMAYNRIISSPYVDMVVRGEGEYVMREIVTCMMLKVRKDRIRGLVWKDEDGSVLINELNDPIGDLDNLPSPAYHLLDMRLYIHQKTNNFAYCKKYPVGHMIASRGCLYNCVFCSTSKYFKHFRARSAENILSEIKFLIKNYRIRELHFHDDSLLCSSDLVQNLCQGMLDNRFNISWQASQGMTVWNIDGKILSLMQKSGMYRIGLPIESGSNKTLKFIRKPIDLTRVTDITNECLKLGIYTHGNFIIGFPYETREDIAETEEYIYKSNIDFIKLLICQPLEGSDLYEIYRREGWLNNGTRVHSTYECTGYDTKYFTADELNGIRDIINRNFLKNKLRKLMTVNGFKKMLLPKINQPDKCAYFIKLVFVSLKRLLTGKTVLGV